MYNRCTYYYIKNTLLHPVFKKYKLVHNVDNIL